MEIDVHTTPHRPAAQPKIGILKPFPVSSKAKKKKKQHSPASDWF